MAMRPLDRVTRRLSSLRRYVVATGLIAGGQAVLIVVQAAFLSSALAHAVMHSASNLAGALAGFSIAICARALLSWGQRTTADRGIAHVKTQVRGEIIEAAVAQRGKAGETVTLATKGVDGLDAYINGYLPQLCLAATMPIIGLAVVFAVDVSSGVIIALTLPLIPIFGILIGLQTKTRMNRQWRKLSMLGGHFLDMIAGLTTLRAHGRARDKATDVRAAAHGYRRATMSTLRVAFMSALALELVATVGVALVAVPIGLQLVDGAIAIQAAFFLLLLAPEIYAPLRAVGTQYHAAQEGLTALHDAFEVIDGKPNPRAKAARRDVPFGTVNFEQVVVGYEGRSTPALEGVDAAIEPGSTVALVGPSGAGKTSLLNALLGFAQLRDGTISCAGCNIDTIDHDEWLRRIAWIPQRPHLFAMSVADNIALGQPDAERTEILAAARDAYVNEFIDDLPAAMDTRLGEEGYGLSAGQRRRIGLARAFLRIRRHDCPLVLLDEPTAGLDAYSEKVVAEATTRLLDDRTAILVAHRPALLDRATQVWHIADNRLIDVRQNASLRASHA